MANVTSIGRGLGGALLVGMWLVVTSFGCSKESEARVSPKEGETKVAMPGAGAKSALPVSDGPAFSVTPVHASCEQGKTCSASIRLTAMNGYHLNKEYPYRFTVESKGECEFAKTTFTKDDFQKQSDTTGVMPVTCTAPKKSGKFPFSGTFKFSVCTDEKCLIESATVSLQANVK